MSEAPQTAEQQADVINPIDIHGLTDVDFPDDKLIALTVFSEAGGTYKTTTVANTAASLARKGLDVLVIDLDPQEACLSYLFDVDDDKSNSDADHLLKHIGNQGDGDFYDLIRDSGEGFDIIPSHNKLLKFGAQLENLERMAENYEDDPDFNRYAQLQNTLRENRVAAEYDAILVDPQATPSDKLYNAIYATRTLLSPVEASGKGALSLDGLEELTQGLEDTLGIGVGVAAVVPQDVGSTNTEGSHALDVQEGKWNVPVSIGKRRSMMKEMWNAQASAFRVIEEGWRDNEPGARRSPSSTNIETLHKFDELADHLITLYSDIEQEGDQ